MESGKLFQKAKKITIKTYSPQDVPDYYKFVEENYNLGFRQIIITSEIMLKLTEHYFVNRNFIINRIEFIEEDPDLNEEINYLLEKLKKDRAYWANLTKRLIFLANHDSIDIKRVELINKERGEDYGLILFYQVNGIFGINSQSFESESKNILSFIEGCLK